MHMPFAVGICLVAILGMAAPVATPDDYGGAAAAWKPAFTPHGFNLLGMRHARPGAGFKEAHFRWIRGWGFNFVRLPLDYRCWVKGRTSANREEIDEAGFKPLDEGIALARKYGLVTMLCLHRIPGEYCIESVDPEPGNLYTDPDCLRAAVKHWTALATRYHDVPREELFFNLVNEPSAAKGTLAQYEHVCRVLIAAIRKVDPKRFIVVDGWATGAIPVPGLYGVPGVGQATRGYFPQTFSGFGVEVGTRPTANRRRTFAPTWPPRPDRPDGRLGGPRWPDWHEPFVVTNAPAADYALALGEVSGPVTLSVTSDGSAVAAFRLEPKPNDPDWSNLSKYRGQGPWRGALQIPLTFRLEKTAHELAIRVTEGDWAIPRALVVRGADGEAQLDFSEDRKAKANRRWVRRFAGWEAADRLPPVNGSAVPPGCYGDAGMDAIAAGPLDAWREPLAKGVWCLVGEFGCANRMAHADALAFLASNLKVFRQMGLGWCLWGFSGSRFGILNSFRPDVAYVDWQGEKLDHEMLELLQSYATDDQPACAPASPTDLYLLIGQSNMAGRGALTEGPRLSSDRVWKLDKDNHWVAGVEPIHFDRPNTGVGPGLAFARVMADADPSAGIGLIPCAEGGSPLARWEPGKDLYARAVERTRAALAMGGRLRGILWHQGEADSWSREKAESYAVRLTNMVTHLRAEFGAPDVPFLAGEVGLHYATSIEKRGGKAFVTTVNDQIHQAVASLPAAGYASAEGLEPGPDGIHFTAESASELGRRYAAALQALSASGRREAEGD